MRDNNISVIVCEYPPIDLVGQEAIDAMVKCEEVQGRAFVMVSTEERARRVYQPQADIQEVVIPFDIDSFAELVYRSRLAARFERPADSPNTLYA